MMLFMLLLSLAFRTQKRLRLLLKLNHFNDKKKKNVVLSECVYQRNALWGLNRLLPTDPCLCQFIKLDVTVSQVWPKVLHSGLILSCWELPSTPVQRLRLHLSQDGFVCSWPIKKGLQTQRGCTSPAVLNIIVDSCPTLSDCFTSNLFSRL